MLVSGYWIFEGNYLFLSSIKHPVSSILDTLVETFVFSCWFKVPGSRFKVKIRYYPLFNLER
jgi:hypothetical protein